MQAIYISLILYVVLLGFLTYLAARKKRSGDFLVASRGMPWWVLALSIFASIISSYNIVVGLSFSYLFGPWVLLVYGGAMFGFYVMYRIVQRLGIEHIREKNYTTVIDFFRERFGERSASLFHLAILLVLFVFIALQFFINTSLFTTLVGWSTVASVLFVGIVVLLYMFSGGLKVEMFTDVFQGILMLGLVSLIFFVDTSHVQQETIMSFLHDRTLIVGAFSLAIAQFLTLLAQPEMWQRVYASRSLRDLKKGFLFSWVLIIAFIIPIVIIGVSARAAGVEDPGNLFYTIVQFSAPSWFLPFISVALFAAFMSTLDSSLFALGSQIGKYGFWIRRRKEFSDRELVRRTRIALVVSAVLAMLVSLYFTNFIQAVMQLVSLFTVISVVILASFIFRMSEREIWYSALVALVAYGVALFGGYITAEAYTVLYPSMITALYIVLQHLYFSFRRKKKA